MNLNRRPPLAAAVALVIAVGCATPTVGEDPGTFDPDAPIDSGSGGNSSASGGGMPGSGGTTNTAGMPASSKGGGPGSGTGGSSATGGAGTNAGGGSSGIATCPAPREPATPGVKNGDSGSFATADAVCYFVEGSFNAWNCSNLGGRTVTVNGAPTLCGGALPMPLDGGYYFEFSASPAGTNYTSFYWYTQ